MADTPNAQIWTGRIVFVLLSALIIFLHLLPLDSRPESWPVPDFMLLIAAAWSARRPEFAPITFIALVTLLADLLFQRPPGLWAGLVVILCEILRRRARQFRNMPILLEWMSVALGIIAITVAYRLILAIVATPQGPITMTILQTGMTIALYPAIVGLAHVLFGVSRPAPGQTDSLGHRL